MIKPHMFGLSLSKLVTPRGMPFDKLRANGMTRSFPRHWIDFLPFGLSLSKPVLPWGIPFDKLGASGIVQGFP
ncbi:MAG: hypothetical protein LBI68_07415 [Azoarcus sp.]|jgi:hypothetical protein|nr:hypothetical protein [Azoarcus sp.]